LFYLGFLVFVFFFSSRRRHTRFSRDWSSDVCSSDLIVQFAFEEKNYHKVFARYFASNPASGRVLQKIGMQQEGVLRDHVLKENRFEDLVYYGILKNEMEAIT